MRLKHGMSYAAIMKIIPLTLNQIKNALLSYKNGIYDDTYGDYRGYWRYGRRKITG